jgi:hypothetical protein
MRLVGEVPAGIAPSGIVARPCTGIMPVAYRGPCASVSAIVIHRQEVRPMNAISAVGAPLQSTIARLR